MKGKRNATLPDATAAAAHSLEGMNTLFAICNGLQEAIRPFSDLQRQLRRAQAHRLQVDGLGSAVRQIIENQSRSARAVARLQLGSVGTTARKLARHAQRAQALDEAGWLPHYSMPFDRMEECAADADAIHKLLCRHYGERWSAVRRDIEARLTEYDIDEEAKATFLEALTAHEASFYRSVCRVLLPEIERVSRVELHGDGLDRITSQSLLRELTARLPISSVEPSGFLALNLYRRLSEHLYEHVDDENTRRRFAKDPVPNRHAAVHGLVVYSSMQNSLNTLFTADFIFQAIGILMRLASGTCHRMNGR